MESRNFVLNNVVQTLLCFFFKNLVEYRHWLRRLELVFFFAGDFIDCISVLRPWIFQYAHVHVVVFKVQKLPCITRIQWSCLLLKLVLNPLTWMWKDQLYVGSLIFLYWVVDLTTRGLVNLLSIHLHIYAALLAILENSLVPNYLVISFNFCGFKLIRGGLLSDALSAHHFLGLNLWTQQLINSDVLSR